MAREGHVALAPPHRRPAPGDSSQMVDARVAFLAAGHYAPIAAAIVAAGEVIAPAVTEREALAVDLGAGTGYHLAALLSAQPHWRGVALDASRPALRRAVSAHERIAAVVCDAWQPLPIRDGAAELVVNVFAPRNAREIARMLAPEGALIVVTPTPRHLRELVDSLGLLSVDADKQDRLHAQLAPQLESVRRRELDFEMELDRKQLSALIAMGPNAHHIDSHELSERLARLPEHTPAQASVVIETFGLERRRAA